MKRYYCLFLLLSCSLFALNISAQDWTLDQSFANPNNLTGVLKFGATVAMDGNTMVLGAAAENTSTGAAYVYEYDGTDWQFLVRLEGSGLMTGDAFGTSLAIDGDVIAIGAPGADGTLVGSGAVYVWEKPIAGWATAGNENVRLSTDLYSNGQFGFQVSLRGNEILISARNEKGAPSETDNNGAVYLYSKASNDGWDKAIQTARFYFPSVTSRPNFGRSISLQDDFIVISGQTSSSFNQGVVYVFEEPVSGWVNSQIPTAEFAKSTWVGADNFGTSVVATSDQIVISGYIFGTGGEVFVFNRPGSGWSSASLYTEDYSIISPYTANTDDNFGNHMSISEKRLVVGSFFDKGAGTVNSGRVYTYLLGAANANFENEFISPNAVNQGFFGNRVSISGPNILVGTDEGNEGNAYIFRGSYSTNASDLLCFGSTYSFGSQTITSPGTYNETFTASDGLDSLVTLTLTQNPQLNFAFNFDPILCNGGTGGIIFDSPSGGDGGPYEYAVDGVSFQTSPTFTGLSAGNLTLVLRDGSGCTRAENTVLQEPAEVLITSTNVTDPNCSSTNDGSVDVQMTGGSGGYYYGTDGVNYQFSGAGTFTISSLVAGNYTVYVKDGNDCEKTTSVTLTGPPVINISTSTSNPLCVGASNGSITNILASGGNGGPFTYSLDGTNFQTANSFSGLAAGAHTVFVQDNSGCFQSKTYNLTDPSPITASATTTNSTSCSAPDGIISLAVAGGAGAYTYTLDGNAVSNPINGLSAGTYSIEITDSNGCAVTISESVTEPAGPQVATNFTDPTCNGAIDGTFSAVGSGGIAPYQYSFSGGAFGSSQNATGLGVGLHTVIVRDANGCTGTASVFLVEPSELTISAVVGTDLNCHQGGDGAIAITATGGTPIYTYSLDGTNFQSFDTPTDVDISNLDAGTYNITIKDLNGCTKMTSVILAEPTMLSFTTTTTDVSCFGESDGAITSIAPSGGNGAPYNYSIDGVNFQTTPTFSGLLAGQVTVYVQDVNGCEISQIETILEPTPITATVSKTETSTCGASDGQLVVTATGGVGPYTFSLNGGSTQSGSTFSGLSSGVYAIDIADAAGCISSLNTIISDPITATITTSTTDAFCGGSMDGSITVNVTGGTAPIEYSLDGGAFQSSNEFTNLGGGSYSVSVKEANGCIQSVMATVIEPDPSLPAVGTNSYSTTYGTAISNWTFFIAAADMVSTHFYIDNIQGSGLFVGSAPLTTSAFILPTDLPTLTFTPESVGMVSFDVLTTFGTSNLACASGNPLTVTITVDPATLTITADDKSRKYGEANPALTFSYAGFVNGEDETSLTNLPSISSSVAAGSAIGNYDIIASGAIADNYDFVYVNGSLSVTQADLVVTANDQQVVFGQTAQLDGTIAGIENSDNITANYSTAATATSNAGTYAITATLVDPDSRLGNYNVTNNAGTLTINKVDQTISFAAIDDIDLVNATSTTLSATSDAGLPITFSVTQGQSIASISGNVVTVTNTGNVTVEASQAGNNNYNAASATQAFNIVDSRKTDQTITFGSIADKTYGDTPFTLAATASSNLAVQYALTGPATISGNEVSITGTGLVTITANQTGDNTFNPAPSVTQTFTILKGSISVEGNDKSMVYGDQLPTLDGTFSGVVYNDNITVTYGTAGDGTEAGSFAITATIGDPDSKLSNYDLSNTAGTLTVAKASLSITANDYEITFGDAIPTLEGVISGIKNNDNISGTYMTTATSASDVGEYAVEASLVDQDSRLNNYEVTTTGGKLIISKADQTIAFNQINSIDIANTNTVNLVGTSSSNLQVAFSLSEGDGSISGNVLTVNSSGNFTVVASQAGNSNYNMATEISQSFQVVDSRKIDQTITFNGITDKSYGALFTLVGSASSQLSVSYNLTGPAIISGNEVSVTGVGEIVITATQSGDGDFNPAPDVSQSFMALKVNLTATADDKTISEGDALPTFTISYSGFVNGEDEVVLDMEPQISTTVTNSAIAGEFAISLSEGSDDNYAFTLFNGTLTIEEVLGLSAPQTIEVYPNPFTEHLAIEGVGIEAIEIRDLAGKVLIKTEEKNINTSDLNAGIYILILKDGDRKILDQVRIKKVD